MDLVAIPWSRFADAQPELAAHGRRLIYQHGAPLGYLATVRKDGGPRVHPVCPVVAEGRLWVFVPRRTPKWWDLRRDPRFALHAFPPGEDAPEPDEEFYVAGEAVATGDDPDVRARVAAGAPHAAPPTEDLFELRIERALHTRWEQWGTPQIRPVHTTWRAGT